MSYPIADTESNEVMSTTAGAQFDVKKFIFKLVGFLPWIIISILVGYSIATLYLRYTAKVHKITAQLLIKDDEATSPDYNIIRDLGVMPGSKEIQDQIDILQSYALAKNVVDSLHLQIQIYAQGRVASSSSYGNLNPVFIQLMPDDTMDFKPATYRLMVMKNKFSLQAPGEKEVYYNYGDTFLLDNHKAYVLPNTEIRLNEKGYTLLLKTTRAVASAIKTALDVRKLHDMGGILAISTTDEVPQKAIDVVNALIESFINASKTDKSIVAKKTNQFLKDRVDDVEKKLDTLEIAADSFKSNNKILDISVAGNQYLAQISDYDKQKVSQEGEIKLLDGLADYIRNSKSYTDIIPSNNGIAEATLTLLITQYNADVIKYAAQLRMSPEKDPILERQRSEITNIKQSILKNIQSIKTGYETKLGQIDHQYNLYSDLLTGLPEKERVLVNLKRQIDVQEQLYTFLLQKKADAELSLAAVTEDARVVDYAHDDGVVKPNASQIKMFSILIGIILPIIVMLLLDFFNNRLADRREVEEGTRAPVLGELSYNARQKNAIVTPHSRSVLAEQFRLIRTNLHYMASDKKAKTILVTSFMSGEGKSFVSLNLAGSLVSSDRKVLLLELDLRKPKLAKYLDLQSQKGLTDYLIDDGINEREIITRVPGVNNVDVILSGPIPPNPTELIMSDRFSELLKTIKGKYDYVVIDSSPVGLVADAFIVAQSVDITMFIIRHKYSYKTTIKYIEKLYAEKKFNRLCIIINGIIASAGLGYGYGYGYGYSYGYGYHYGGGYYTEEQRGGLKGLLNKIFKR
ncbi:MAG TPA: polysaccharide biosynthesis tyrosine autokinase [Chitinophagaceae bacterium]|nr:polysaccharide biosynthesis tyrosine autokinase [Chitinophagaceae bacterium]